MELNLSTLEYRRKRYDIIQVFKIIHKIDDIDMSKFFTFTDNLFPIIGFYLYQVISTDQFNNWTTSGI